MKKIIGVILFSFIMAGNCFAVDFSNHKPISSPLYVIEGDLATRSSEKSIDNCDEFTETVKSNIEKNKNTFSKECVKVKKEMDDLLVLSRMIKNRGR